MLSWIKSKDCLADPKRRYKNHALRVSKRKESKEREREKRPSDDSKGRNEEADEERRGKKEMNWVLRTPIYIIRIRGHGMVTWVVYLDPRCWAR